MGRQASQDPDGATYSTAGAERFQSRCFRGATGFITPLLLGMLLSNFLLPQLSTLTTSLVGTVTKTNDNGTESSYISIVNNVDNNSKGNATKTSDNGIHSSDISIVDNVNNNNKGNATKTSDSDTHSSDISTVDNVNNNNSTADIDDDRKEEPKQIGVVEDGCSTREWNPRTSKQIQWVDYSNEQKQTYQDTLQCLLHLHRMNRWAESPDDLRYEDRQALKCNDEPEITRDTISAAFDKFDRVYFVGDSVLHQIYLSIVCRYFSADFMNRTKQIDFPPMDDESFMKAGMWMNDPKWTYIRSGRKFDGDKYFHHSFGDLIQNTTNRDLIIFNAGLHYDCSVGHAFQFLLKALRDKYGPMVQKSGVKFLLLETPLEQWPTSNGQWSFSCTNGGKGEGCECVPLSQSQLDGNAAAYDAGPNAVNITGLHWQQRSPWNVPTIPNPEYWGLLPYDDPSWRTNLECIPWCFPANWRNDLLRNINLGPSITVVPLAWQLHAQHKSQGRIIGDCIHKSLEALIAIHDQITRSLLKT